MTDPPRPFKVYATRGAHPPVSAVDDHGNDMLARISSMDRQYPDGFLRDRIRGYAAEHTLTMNLADAETVPETIANTGAVVSGTKSTLTRGPVSRQRPRS